MKLLSPNFFDFERLEDVVAVTINDDIIRIHCYKIVHNVLIVSSRKEFGCLTNAFNISSTLAIDMHLCFTLAIDMHRCFWSVFLLFLFLFTVKLENLELCGFCHFFYRRCHIFHFILNAFIFILQMEENNWNYVILSIYLWLVLSLSTWVCSIIHWYLAAWISIGISVLSRWGLESLDHLLMPESELLLQREKFTHLNSI